MGAYRSFFAAVAAFIVAFPVTVIFIGMPFWLGLVCGGVLALAGWLIIKAAWPYDENLDGYRFDAQRRVRNLRKQMDTLRANNRRIDSESARAAITRGCELIDDVITLTQQKDPNSVASVAAGLAPFLESAKGIQSVYLELQKDTDIPGNTDRMRDCEAAFDSFKSRAKDRKVQALSGDLTQLKIDIARLKPLSEPNLEGF